MGKRPHFLLAHLLCVLALIGGAGATVLAASWQKRADKDRQKEAPSALAEMAVRVRVTKIVPEEGMIHITWRRGGEGLRGDVVTGEFPSETQQPELAVGAWSAWLPLPDVVGRGQSWEFPTIVVWPAQPNGNRAEESAPRKQPSGKKRRNSSHLKEVAVEFQFAHNGKVFKSFTEVAPKGATVSFAFPGHLLGDRGALDSEFVAYLQGISGHARARRERVEAFSGHSVPRPTLFGVLGHLGGYGEGAGHKIRHCNPAILTDECRSLRLLGVNGLVGEDSVNLAGIAGLPNQMRRIYWGGPGSGSPMSFFRREKYREIAPCPFEPALKAAMADRVREAIDEHRRVGAEESWAQWWDEIGVAAKDHIDGCARCTGRFRDYLRSQNVQPRELGRASWGEVTPYPLWELGPSSGKGKNKDRRRLQLVAAPTSAPEAVRYYYTVRFLTYATAQLFPEAAKQLKGAGIPLFAMHGPTPSLRGSSLDWHEFFDLGANTALVWETSSRDPRIWQWESYLGDLARGISMRHGVPIGCLIKPHRGAAEQRMLSVVSRGAEAIRWYTYGPDYAKGDSFSQSPELLEQVARAGQFLGQAEPWLYRAQWAGQPEVAFVSPRSSEIWGRATDQELTAFEDAKWVYLALAHAHIPVDVLSEQQLAEGNLGRYKVIYIVGPNLRRDAAAKVLDWVRAGGVLWTDALGLSQDEANQPATEVAAALGFADRRLETWGSVSIYKGTRLEPLRSSSVPRHGTLFWDIGDVWGEGKTLAAVGREVVQLKDDASVLARFADDSPAAVRRRYGQGELLWIGTWAGLTYSAQVRDTDFDMRRDFDPSVRNLIAAAALQRDVYRPVVPAEPLVEAILLDKDGRRSVALINWSYRSRDPSRSGFRAGTLQPVKNLRVAMPGVGPVTSVRSLRHGDLIVEDEGAARSVLLPQLDAIDLLVIE